MNGILSRYIFVVTIFLWIPLNYACMDQSLAEFMNCTADIVPMTNISTEDQTKFVTDMMCRENSKEKEKYYACINSLTECKEIVNYAALVGIDIKRVIDAEMKLCKHEEDIFSGMPCFLNNVKNITTDFESFYKNITHLISDMVKLKITKDEYLERYCPLMKDTIDNVIDSIKCPEKFVKLLQTYFYDIMSDKCRQINNMTADGIKEVSNIYFILLLILTILFTIG